MAAMRSVRLLAFSLIGLASLSAAPGTQIAVKGERRLDFNGGWRFFKGEAEGAQRPEFDDSSWRPLQLPHDWAIEGPFDRKYNPHSGGLPFFGVGWYRKTFSITEAVRGSIFSILFDGAMSNARVWLNGEELGGRPYGYIPFSFDLTSRLRTDGKDNVLAVRLAPEDLSSRWYPGAGIYRNVWLEVTMPVRVEQWGAYVTTPEVSDEKATVSVRTSIRNGLRTNLSVVLRTAVLDAEGKEVTDAGKRTMLYAMAAGTVETTLTVEKPQRWDIDRPYLYRLLSEVQVGGEVADRHVTPFGIRSIAFDKEKGFQLNGRTRKLQGVCLHHDLGALGAAVNRRATERQLQIMKAMGVNAIRTSHNPPSPELLDLCDRLGLVVMDEAFDMWRIPKVANGYSKYFDEWSERDVRDFVRRDRNHPSVIMWSIGNEVPEQSRADGAQVARRLVDLFHQEDPTRPTTSAFNQPDEAIKNGLAAVVDIPGINYKPLMYGRIMEEHPNWILAGAETASCVSSRGVYHLPIEKYEKHPSLQLSSYDIIAPPWAYCPDPEFAAQEKYPNVLGEFVWTGFDYLGEPTPFFVNPADNDWPARSSYFGIVDLAGFPKDRYYLYQSVWTKAPMVHLLPHWNWAGMESREIPVMAYTNAEELELFLNGKSLGRKKRGAEPVEIPVGPNISPDKKYMTKYRLQWQVPYAAGTLRAVAWSGSRQVASDEVRTAGAPARIRLVPDRAKIAADGYDLSFVTVRVEDKSGNLCPQADNLVRFKVEGAGRIAAVDNGNAATVEPFQADYRKAFNGLALLIVRSEAGKGGRIRVAASSDRLAGATAAIDAAAR
jgi:beta-galactosidase